MLTFTDALVSAGVSLSEVRLLRHQEKRGAGSTTPYRLWRDCPKAFERYQSTQSFGNAAKLRAPYWASFVGTPAGETLFMGLYRATHIGLLPEDRPFPLGGSVEVAGSCDIYDLALIEPLRPYSGRLMIEWGLGFRSWVQRADGAPKAIVELRRKFEEEGFPGFSAFVRPLSQIDNLPAGWAAALATTRGIYLLTCPRTKEQYVGSACGQNGFLGRWRDYVANGHGGNIELKSRDLSDYQVSVLETVGNTATEADILQLEQLWKTKLQSREMGLNRN